MPILRCKSCGAALNVSNNIKVVECEYCGLKQTIPNTDNEELAALFEEANSYRAKNEFDKAAIIYGNIISKKKDEAEAYWGTCLCRYGIEYVEDPKNGDRIPTCHKTQFKSILDDEDYKKAVENADLLSQQLYEEEAHYIDNVQKEILSISSKEEPFDIFICYKETDLYEERTVDSVLAEDIYSKLTQKGYKVFFSRITLEDKLGSAYEPYIFAALNSAKIMLVVGTRQEYFNAIWVKNEWSRYIELIEQGKEKTLIPCYKGMTPYDLPKEFVSLQSQDMGKVGAMHDLIRGIQKIHNIEVDIQKEKNPNHIDISSLMMGNVNSILKRGYMFLEDGEFQQATDCFNRCLDINPEVSDAYWGLVLVDAGCRNNNEIIKRGQSIKETKEYRYALRFADSEQNKKYDEINKRIIERKEGTISALKTKKMNELNKIISETAFFECKTSVKEAEEQIIELIANLKETEMNIKTVFEKCQKSIINPLESMRSSVLYPSRQIKEELRQKVNGIYPEEKEQYISRINMLNANYNDSLQEIQRFKNNSAEFEELKKLIGKQRDLILQINNIKQNNLSRQKEKLNNYLLKVQNIVNKYNLLVNQVNNEDYKEADLILKQD